MGGKLNLFNLGRLGVNVDKDPIHLDDGELTQAQNVQVDTVGVLGGIRKRDGMSKLNSIALAGSVKGMIALPLPDNAALTRHFYIGIDDRGGVVSGNKWRHSTDGLSWAMITTTPAIPSSMDKFGATVVNAIFRSPWISLNNKMYYGGNDYTTVTGNPTLRVWDGTTDFELTKIPQNPYAAQAAAYGIVSIVPYSSREIMITTYDENTRSRVLLIDVHDGTITHVGPETDISGDGEAFSLVPYVFQGRIWYSTYNGGGGVAAGSYFIRPGDAEWTQDSASVGGATSLGYTHGIIGFLGDLFFGLATDVGGNGVIRKRTTSTGAYSTVFTATSAGGALNGVGPFMLQQDQLKVFAFVTDHNDTVSTGPKILKSTNGTSWTTEYDVNVQVGAGYIQSGYPVLDANGDIYWPVMQAAQQTKILKRTSAGTWSIVDTSNSITRGNLITISF